MNKSMLGGIGIGVAAALGVAAVALLNVLERGRNALTGMSAARFRER